LQVRQLLQIIFNALLMEFGFLEFGSGVGEILLSRCQLLVGIIFGLLRFIKLVLALFFLSAPVVNDL